MLFIQSDWPNALSETGGKAWISYRNEGYTSEHSFIERKENGSVMSTSDAFAVNLTCKDHLEVVFKGHKFIVIPPVVTFTSIHSSNAVFIDINNGGLGVSTSDHDTKVWELSSGAVRRTLTGHLSDVYTCKFFPSGTVVLTSSADMLLKIWSTENGTCAATLKGHKGPVMDTCIIDKGRNIISVSKDSFIKLWDCGRSSIITDLHRHDGIINCCSVAVAPQGLNLGSSSDSHCDREVGTFDKMLVFGGENGDIVGVGCYSRSVLFKYMAQESVNCVAVDHNKMVYAGTDSGRILMMDPRNFSTPVMEWKDSKSPVKSILINPPFVFISHQDGSCHSLVNSSNLFQIQLSGPDCDAVNKIVGTNNDLFTCCKDGVIRKYCICF